MERMIIELTTPQPAEREALERTMRGIGDAAGTDLEPLTVTETRREVVAGIDTGAHVVIQADGEEVSIDVLAPTLPVADILGTVREALAPVCMRWMRVPDGPWGEG